MKQRSFVLKVPSLALLMAASGWLAGCDFAVEVDIPIPPHEPQLVVNALFETDTTLTVHLSQSLETGKTGSTSVQDGHVYLYMDGELVEQLRPAPPFGGFPDSPMFYVSDHVMQPGRLYRVEAEARGLGPVSAEERTLPLPSFELVSVTPGVGTDPWYRESRVLLRMFDAPGRDFYHLTFPIYVVYDNSSSGEGQFLPSPFRSDDPILQEGQFFDLFNTGGRRYAPAVIFSDAAFDGESYILTIDVLLPTDVHPSTAAAYIRLDAATEDYYQYVRAQQVLDDNEGNPFAEPVTLPSNVAGGLGIFAGRSGRNVPLYP